MFDVWVTSMDGQRQKVKVKEEENEEKRKKETEAVVQKHKVWITHGPHHIMYYIRKS